MQHAARLLSRTDDKVETIATAVGTLLIHGFRAPVRAEVQLESLPPGPAGQLRVMIRSAARFGTPASHSLIGGTASPSS